jgi:EmrB/QacA subfamily drug resistance transporter
MSHPEASKREQRLVLLAVSVALFMVLIDNTVVNVAIPSIQRDLDASLATLEWTVNAYTLGIAAFLVTGGRLGDMFGRRRVFVTGIVLFAIASVAVAAAPSPTAIIVARSAQGIAAALLMPGTLSLLTEAFPREQRGRAIGIWSGVAGVALVIGPLLGGAIIEVVSWRAIFLVNVPISVGAVALTLLVVRESRDEEGEPSLDVPGIVTLTTGLAALTLALVEGNNWGWGSTRIVALFAATAAALAAFAVAESRARTPILDLGWMRSRRVSGPSIASAAIAFVMFGMLFFVTIYLQRTLGYSPLKAGAAFLPAMAVAAVTAPVAGWACDRVGTRTPMIAGLLVAAASMFAASGVSESSGYGRLVPALVLLGLAMAFVIAPTSTAVMNAVSEAGAGVAAGVVSMTRMVGGTLGIAVLGAVFQSAADTDLLKAGGGPATQDAIARALADAMLVGAGVTLASALFVWLMLRPGRPATAEARTPAGARTGQRLAEPSRPLSGHLSDG